MEDEEVVFWVGVEEDVVAVVTTFRAREERLVWSSLVSGAEGTPSSLGKGCGWVLICFVGGSDAYDFQFFVNWMLREVWVIM